MGYLMVKPIHMLWGMPGCKIIKEWKEPIKSGTAIGTATYIVYTDAKGKEREMMKLVVWEK